MTKEEVFSADRVGYPRVETRDGTLQWFVSLPARFVDGRWEYLIGATARSPDGWATVPEGTTVFTGPGPGDRVTA